MSPSPSPPRRSSHPKTGPLRRLIRVIKAKRPHFTSLQRKKLMKKRLSDASNNLADSLNTYSPREAELVLKYVSGNRTPLAAANRVIATLVKVNNQFAPEHAREGRRALEVILATPASFQTTIGWLENLPYSHPEFFVSREKSAKSLQQIKRQTILRSLFLNNLAVVESLKEDLAKQTQAKRELRKKKSLASPRQRESDPLATDLAALHRELTPLLSRVPASERAIAERLVWFAEEYTREYWAASRQNDERLKSYCLRQRESAISAIRNL